MKVTGVALTPALSLAVGHTSTLTAAISPRDATNQTVTWTSSNTSVASINNGVVTAVTAGAATITVITADGGFTKTCEVMVTASGGNGSGSGDSGGDNTTAVASESLPKLAIYPNPAGDKYITPYQKTLMR